MLKVVSFLVMALSVKGDVTPGTPTGNNQLGWPYAPSFVPNNAARTALLADAGIAAVTMTGTVATDDIMYEVVDFEGGPDVHW